MAMTVREDTEMKTFLPIKTALAAAALALGACSGPSEDVRVSFCKNMSKAAIPEADSVEWQSNENTFRRPEYAIAALSFDVTGRDGTKSMHRSECYFAYDVLDDTALQLADPFTAYSTLPFAMTLDGRMLPDAELVRLRSDEQARIGKAAVKALESNAKALADKVRAGIGQ